MHAAPAERVTRCAERVRDVLGAARTVSTSASPGRGQLTIVWSVRERHEKVSRSNRDLAIALAREALDPSTVRWRRVGKTATLRACTTTARVAGAPAAAAKRHRTARWLDALSNAVLTMAIASVALMALERVFYFFN